MIFVHSTALSNNKLTTIFMCFHNSLHTCIGKVGKHQHESPCHSVWNIHRLSLTMIGHWRHDKHTEQMTDSASLFSFLSLWQHDTVFWVLFCKLYFYRQEIPVCAFITTAPRLSVCPHKISSMSSVLSRILSFSRTTNNKIGARLIGLLCVSLLGNY